VQGVDWFNAHPHLIWWQIMASKQTTVLRLDFRLVECRGRPYLQDERPALVKEVSLNKVVTKKWNQESWYVQIDHCNHIITYHRCPQLRREAPGTHARHDHISLAPPPAPRGFSGSNSIPIGSRKGQNNGQMAQPLPPGANRRSGAPLSGGNVEPVRNRAPRGAPQNAFDVRLHSCSIYCGG
jgi:hypothetical protein